MVMLSYDLTQMVFVELCVEVLRIVAIIMLFICMFTRNIAWFMVCLLSLSPWLHTDCRSLKGRHSCGGG